MSTEAVANAASSWQIKWRLLLLLIITLPLTVATKFLPTGDMSFDEGKLRLKMQNFLKSQQAQPSTQTFINQSLQPIQFSYQNCDSYVVVLPPSDYWRDAIARRTPAGYIFKFRYKDYLGDDQPKYRATFNEFYEILVHPRSQENRRQPILALITTPECMQTIQKIDWIQFWPH